MRLVNFQIFCAICRHRQVLIFVANCLPTRNSLRKFRKKTFQKHIVVKVLKLRPEMFALQIRAVKRDEIYSA